MTSTPDFDASKQYLSDPASMGQRRVVIPTPAGPYAVVPEAKAALKKSARDNCYKCKGTGISGWKRDGYRAVVCKCAEAGWRLLSGQSTLVPPEKAEPLIVGAQPNPHGALSGNQVIGVDVVP